MRRSFFCTRAAVPCATTARQCSARPRSTMTSAISRIEGTSSAIGRPANTWPMSQPKRPSRAMPSPTARRPIPTAPAIRQRTPLVKTRRRGSMCIRIILWANIHIRQSTNWKNGCTFLNMNANWDDLRVFLALAREGTLSTAAKALGVSHPTVSRRVQAQEHHIGARLFDRLPARRGPSTPGEELLADTEAMEKAALSIERRSAGLSDTVSGVVRLSAGEALGVLVARHLPWLRARLQQMEFEVIASHTLANLSRREADLLIREQVPDLAGLVTRKLCQVAYAVYAGDRLELKRTAMPALVDLPWIGFDDDHSYMPGQHWIHEQICRRPEIRVNNWLVLHDAVRSGVGLGVLPCYLADQDPRLRRVGGVLPEITTEQWLLVHRDLRALPRVRAVMDALVELFQRQRSHLA